MTIKLLESGYWHIRLSLNRFAQWPIGALPKAEDFFGWWSQQEMNEAAALALERKEKMSEDTKAYIIIAIILPSTIALSSWWIIFVRARVFEWIHK